MEFFSLKLRELAKTEKQKFLVFWEMELSKFNSLYQNFLDQNHPSEEIFKS